MSNLYKRIRYFIFLRFRYLVELLPWRILDLHLETLSGIKLKISSRPDWQIYNEIFVRNDYDFAIKTALDKTDKKQMFRFLDLGANVGFFSLRVIDIVRQYDPDLQVEGVLIEGSLPVFKNLEKRISQQSQTKKNFMLVYGLAGKKEGHAKIFESGNTVTNSVSSTSSLRKQIFGRRVAYVDIDKFFWNNETINLLKCDIEGSEEVFIENYFSLLCKTVVGVFEIHHKRCNAQNCFNIILKAGFNNQKTIFNYGGDTSLEVFWKNV